MTSNNPARALGVVLGIAVFALFFAPLSCDSPRAGGPIGSNTNWLKTCDDALDCGGEGDCLCGTCSLECTEDADCSEVPGARCAGVAESSARSQCLPDTPAYGLCLAGCEPGDCGPTGACVGGACVRRPWPASALCDALPEPDATELGRQDRLLALLQGLRTEGGVECGAAAASVPVPELRWDPRLSCAARGLAVDMAVSRSRSLVDSEGRDTQARLMLVGYSSQIWGEAFALLPGDETAALDAMLADVDSCARFVDDTFLDVGVGSSADAHVVTIGAE